MNLDLKADLAILSACETARERIGNGEGVIGLMWALFVAGVPTTVVSQWSVDSIGQASCWWETAAKTATWRGTQEVEIRCAPRLPKQ